MSDDDGKGKLELEDVGEETYSALQTIRSIVLFVLAAAAIAGLIGLLSTAPWMRVSHDCSIFCVIEQELREFFS